MQNVFINLLVFHFVFDQEEAEEVISNFETSVPPFPLPLSRLLLFLLSTLLPEKQGGGIPGRAVAGNGAARRVHGNHAGTIGIVGPITPVNKWRHIRNGRDEIMRSAIDGHVFLVRAVVLAVFPVAVVEILLPAVAFHVIHPDGEGGGVGGGEFLPEHSGPEMKKKHRINSHQIIHCPTSEEVSKVNEQANK